MILVAGLAVAGLVGIAAAFYFSIRTGGSGKKRNSRVRAAGSGRARDDRHLGSSPAARDERPANARWAADNDRTMNAHRGPDSGPNATSGWSATAGARAESQQAWHAQQAQRDVATMAAPAFGAGSTPEVSLGDTPGDAWPGPGSDDSPRPLGGFGAAAPRPGSRSAARLARAAGAGADEDTDKTAKPRRRMGFRKGADMDEEMWPADSFGGVTDDQFWDDLASDKPLARTARTAQQGSANRPLATDPPTQSRPGPEGPKPGGAWGNTRRTGNSAYPEPSPGASERTAVQPVYAAHQPGPAAPAAPTAPATQPVLTQQASTQPTPMAPGQGAPGQGAPGQGAPGQGAPGQGAPGQGAPGQGAPGQGAPGQGASGRGAPGQGGSRQGGSGQGGSGQGTQYLRTGNQPTRTGAAPGETNGRRLGAGSNASEDPLTSAAFSLRSSGPVDGRSNQAPSGPHDISPDRERYPAGGNRAPEDRGRPDRSRPSGGWYRSSDSAAIEDYGRAADAHRGTAAYQYPGQPLGAPVAEAPGTPPYGLPYEAPHGAPYGYGNGNNVPVPSDGPRQPNVTGGPNPAGAPNQVGGPNPAREPSRRGGSGYQPPRQGQGEGHPSGGQRRVRDPRDDYQRLVGRV
jgi:hypothetical protein